MMQHRYPANPHNRAVNAQGADLGIADVVLWALAIGLPLAFASACVLALLIAWLDAHSGL